MAWGVTTSVPASPRIFDEIYKYGLGGNHIFGIFSSPLGQLRPQKWRDGQSGWGETTGLTLPRRGSYKLLSQFLIIKVKRYHYINSKNASQMEFKN